MNSNKQTLAFTIFLTCFHFLKFNFVFLPVTSENLLISSAITYSLTEYFFYNEIKPGDLHADDFKTLDTEINIVIGIFAESMAKNPFLISDLDETIIFGILEQANVHVFIETLGDLNSQLLDLNHLESQENLLEDKVIYKQYSDKLLHLVFEMLEFHSFFSKLQTTLIEEVIESIDNDKNVIEFWKDLFSELLAKLEQVLSNEELDLEFLNILHHKLKDKLEHYFIFAPSRTNINGTRLKDLLHKILKFMAKRNKYTQKLIAKLITKLKDEARFLNHILNEQADTLSNFLTSELKLHEVLRSLTPLFVKLFKNSKEVIRHNNEPIVNVLDKLIFIQRLGEKTNNFYHVHRNAIDFVLLKNIDNTIRSKRTGILYTIKRTAIKLMRKIFKFFPEKLFEIIIGIFISDNLGTAIKKFVEKMRSYFDNK
eukprot:GAHX01003463.1.p1 GENE.GAHX01003463.1~~GAHX01003463.1.p1  ORF type:complete len:426 (-),score=85.70 GAHX01003463.1:22-1299(-)